MRSALSPSFTFKSFSHTSFVCSTCKGEITDWNNFHLVPYFEEFPRCVIVRTVSFLDFIWENSWNSYFELAIRSRAIMQWVFCPHSQLFAQYLSYAICPHNSSKNLFLSSQWGCSLSNLLMIYIKFFIKN